MSKVIDLADTTLFGLTYAWGGDAFNGSMNVGTWDNGGSSAKEGRFAQNYNYTTTTTNSWGDSESHQHAGTNFPTSNLGAEDSSVDGGRQLSNTSVVQRDWRSPNVSTKSNANYKLYSLFSQASQNGYELTAANPWNYNNVYGYTGYTPGTFNVKNSINLSNVEYTANDATLLISEGNLSTTSQQMANGLNLDASFLFVPGATSVLKIDNTFTNSVNSSNTQGTSSSSSQQQQASASFSISDSQTEKIGIEGTGTENTLKSDFEAGWQGTWATATTANFTTTKAVSASNSFAFTVTENLNSAVQTGTTTTANGNKTPLYQYTTNYIDPSTNDETTHTFNLIAGNRYVWNLYYYQGSVQNQVSGEYTASGAAGHISDSSGNTFGGNIAQASYYANQAWAWDLLGYGYNPIKAYNNALGQATRDISEIASMVVDGSTTSSTSLSTNLVLTLSQYENASTTTSSNSLAFMSASSRKRSKNKRKRNTRTDLSELLHQDPSESATTFHYEGSNKVDRLEDTKGRDHIFSGDGDDDVDIQGNTAQAMHSGDYVDLGRGDDRLKVMASKGRNYFDAGSGNDQITDSQADLYGTLGDGDDTYKYAGGNDFLTLGTGRDQIVLNKINKIKQSSQLIVHDFSAATDRVTGIRAKDGSFSWDDTLQAFTLDYKNDNVDVILYVNNDNGNASSSEFWLGLSLLNRKELNLKAKTSLEWQDIRNQYAKHAIDESLTYYDWNEFSSNTKAIHQAYETIAWSCGENVSKNQLNEAIDLASTAGSYQSFIHASLDSLH